VASAANNSLSSAPSAPYRDSNDCTEERVRHVDRPYTLELVFEA